MLGTGKLLARLVALSALLAYHPSLAWSDDSCVWPVKERLFGKHGARSENVSGIACTSERGFPRSCLVIDDELQAAQLVTVKDGELRAEIPFPSSTTSTTMNRSNWMAKALPMPTVPFT